MSNKPIAFPPSALNQWTELDESERKNWLQAARDRFFDETELLQPGLGKGRTVVINGKVVDTPSAFFCAMGEAVNGPGGYFGKTFQSFDDCLFSGFGLEYPYTIVWKNSSLSKAALGKFFDEIVEAIETVSTRNDKGGIVTLVLD